MPKLTTTNIFQTLRIKVTQKKIENESTTSQHGPQHNHKIEQTLDQTIALITQAKALIFNGKNSPLARAFEKSFDAVLAEIDDVPLQKTLVEKFNEIHEIISRDFEKEFEKYNKKRDLNEDYEKFIGYLNTHQNGHQYARTLCVALKKLEKDPELKALLANKKEPIIQAVSHFAEPGQEIQMKVSV